jgi:hypothetical protein
MKLFKSLIDILLIFPQIILELGLINSNKAPYNKGKDNNCADKMCPNINSLIVKNKQTFEHL